MVFEAPQPLEMAAFDDKSEGKALLVKWGESFPQHDVYKTKNMVHGVPLPEDRGACDLLRDLLLGVVPEDLAAQAAQVRGPAGPQAVSERQKPAEAAEAKSGEDSGAATGAAQDEVKTEGTEAGSEETKQVEDDEAEAAQPEAAEAGEGKQSEGEQKVEMVVIPLALRRRLDIVTLFAHSPSLSSYVAFQPDFLPTLRLQFTGAYAWAAWPPNDLFDVMQASGAPQPSKANMLASMVSCASGFTSSNLDELLGQGKGLTIHKGVVGPKQVLYIPGGWVVAVSTRWNHGPVASASASSTSAYTSASSGLQVTCLPKTGLSQEIFSLLAEHTTADVKCVLDTLALLT